MILEGVPFITQAEEKPNQFAVWAKAVKWAKQQTKATGIKHEAILCATWRDLEPRWCYTTRIIPGKKIK